MDTQPADAVSHDVHYDLSGSASLTRLSYPLKVHPIGQLSNAGVLDVGIRCPHSCTFCYYSYWDGSGDQFSGMRHAPWRSRDELISTLQNFKEWGLKRFDVTGGEPTLHPDLVDLMRYATSELGLHPRIITLAQFLDRPIRGGIMSRIDQLLDAGVREYLFSLHAVDDAIFKKITGGGAAPVKRAMSMADERGIAYSTNTVVHVHNLAHLPDIARYIAASNALVANLIVMKVEFSWANKRDGAIERKARYGDLHPYLSETIRILVDAGKGVNLRYGPYCAYKGMERHVVGHKGVQLDPFEWRNGLRGGTGGGPYGKPPFLFFNSLESYKKQHPKEVETKTGYNMSFGEPCRNCALRPICDGVDKDYIKVHGWAEFEPYRGETVTDLLHFRRDYSEVFALPE